MSRSLKKRSSEDIATLWDNYWDAESNEDEVLASRYRQELYDVYVDLVYVVWSTIAPKLPKHYDVQGLISEGFFGLDKAIRKFQPQAAASFKTYATYRIRGAILDELRGSDSMTRSARTLSKKINSFKDNYYALNAEYPSVHVIAEEVGISLDEVYALYAEEERSSLLYYETSSEEDYDTGFASKMYEMMEDESSADAFSEYEYKMIEEFILSGLVALTDQESVVLYWKYGENMLFSDIATRLGVIPSRVSQLHSTALKKIRSHFLQD